MEPFDILPFAGMVFSLLMALIIAGIILMYPVTKRLGKWLEMRIEAGRDGSLPEGRTEGGKDLAELRRVVKTLEQEVATLTERQRFVEGLLDSPERQRTIAGRTGGAGEPGSGRPGDTGS